MVGDPDTESIAETESTMSWTVGSERRGEAARPEPNADIATRPTNSPTPPEFCLTTQHLSRGGGGGADTTHPGPSDPPPNPYPP